MMQRMAVATFRHEQDVLRATAELRQRGFHVLDVYSPHPIHGMDEALGLRPSRLTWVCFVCGACGLLGMLWFQHWVNAVQWPINVGGKPWNSLPAEVPVGFEMLVLLAAFGSVLACLAVCQLFPGRQPVPWFERVSDDQYVLTVGESPHVGSFGDLARIVRRFDVVELREEIVDMAEPMDRRRELIT